VAGFCANLQKEGGGKEWSSYPECGGSRFDKNNGEFLPHYMACPRTQCFSLY